jgi:hypothetical protein
MGLTGTRWTPFKVTGEAQEPGVLFLWMFTAPGYLDMILLQSCQSCVVATMLFTDIGNTAQRGKGTCPRSHRCLA